MRNFVVLVDIDEESSWRRALPTAVDYAGHAGARLHVLTIVPDEMFKMTVVAQLIPEDYESKLIADAKRRLARIVAQQGADGVELEPAVRLGSVYKEALRYARDIDAELIVMGAHKPELKDYLLGSNAAQIVRHAPCSVWVIRG